MKVTRRRFAKILAIFTALAAALWLSATYFPRAPKPHVEAPKEVKLPTPAYDGEVSVERTLAKRRSIRSYRNESLTLGEISQLLWSAQGITDPRGLRTAPSAGALYPLELYVIAGNVKDLDKGVYKYDPREHKIVKVLDGDKREELARAALGQSWVKEGAIDLVVATVYERTTWKYGERGRRYVHMEAGHAAQNLYLQCVSLGLGMVVVGAFYDDMVRECLNLPENEDPLYIIPVGRYP